MHAHIARIAIALSLTACCALANADDLQISGEEASAEQSSDEQAVGTVDTNVGNKVDFVRDIEPLLAKHCYECHGLDVQEGALRLDVKEDAFRGGDSGPAVVGKDPDKSLLLTRLLGVGDGERMPLDERPLSDKQIALVRDWIIQGAHWAVDAIDESDPRRNHWAYLPPQRPSVPQFSSADAIANPIDAFVRERLQREGLRPSPEADKARLIRRVTLDLTGLPPSIAEVDAFVDNDRPNAYAMLVDRLLESPRYGERWATPWLDAARYTDSNGYQRDGRRVYWAYRDWVVRALNGDMPFDRFTIEQIAGDLLPNRSLSQQIATGFHRGTMANVEAGTDPEEEHVHAVVDRVNTTGTVWLGVTIECAQCHSHKYDPFTQREYYQLYAFFNNTEKEIESTPKESRREFIGPKMELPISPEQQQVRERLDTEIVALKDEMKQLAVTLEPRQGEWETRIADPANKEMRSKLPANVRSSLSIASDQRNKNQRELIKKQFLASFDDYRQLRDRLKTVEGNLKKTEPVTTLVMKELTEPRETAVFKRGNFLTPGDVVRPGTPAVLHALPESESPNRLDLARWLIDENNPLVARVTVNRHWAEFFGRGLVETLEDFGVQGTRPTHPKLLDWLATEFVRQGWSMKSLHRLIVTSATYRQSSRVTPELLAADPYNKLYARSPRNRLKAEWLRDNALAIAGRLSDKMYGPPVFPYQPPGVWNHTGRASNDWLTSSGEDLNRRGLYVYWRRTVPYPSFVNFDVPSREACTVKRSRSNTPLQALTLMNDPVYLELAYALANRLMPEPVESASDEDRVVMAFRLGVSRTPQPEEIAVLVNRYRHELDRYRANPKAAERLVKRWKTPADVDLPRLAAWMHVANILLNLDEVITKG